MLRIILSGDEENIKNKFEEYYNGFQDTQNRKSLIVKENMLRRILNKIKRFFRLGVN